ncbi:hypothetical protein DFH07DRAFT_766672 [Mycena maculata]|uniref:SAM domain-containing protein n=1 Tax=Mycena maculata TaxID=230809 RepID=A0AAD7K2I8_9AGAR|nr:hypothetical protein DFH07DRAFT_766672 [Mycena maculata]
MPVSRTLTSSFTYAAWEVAVAPKTAATEGSSRSHERFSEQCRASTRTRSPVDVEALRTANLKYVKAVSDESVYYAPSERLRDSEIKMSSGWSQWSTAAAQTQKPKPTIKGGQGGQGGYGVAGNGGNGGLGKATSMTMDETRNFTEISGGTGGKGGKGGQNGGNGGTGEANVFGSRIVQGKPKNPSVKVADLAISVTIRTMLIEEGYETIEALFLATDVSLKEAGLKHGHINQLKSVLAHHMA